MPTYEYECDKCKKTFDIVQKMSDKPLIKCPTCGSKVGRIFHPVGIVFKGPGFHKTDYRKPEPKEKKEPKPKKKMEKSDKTPKKDKKDT